MRMRVCTLICLCLLLPASVIAQTQITTGVIQGVASDPSGGVLPGVTVEVKNKDTDFSRSSVTDEAGRFVFLQLPPGTYTVQFTLSGFATTVQENVIVSVGQAVNLPIRLQLSSVAQTVTVTTSPRTIEVARTGVANTINERTIESLPILGRKFEDFLSLTPGVSIVQGPDGDEISFAGQRGIFNNISLDGGDYNNGFFGEQAGGQRAAVDITLDAIKEFQVIAAGAPAEFGRTAGGVVNVITKSGTNNTRGSLFFFKRTEGLSSDLSDGTRLEDFRREQFGGTLGGPLRKGKAFYFLAAEGITGDFTRPNLSRPIGTPCSVAAPTIGANEALINGSPDCQRLALLSFFKARLNMDEGLPIEHPMETAAILLKPEVMFNNANRLAVSYNFNHSRKENETFDVATYGNSANGTEGDPARIHVVNANLFSTLSNTTLNEFHVTYSRESRPRSANPSPLKADTGIGFAPTFRFGNPFFLQPGVDELIWRVQLKNNLSYIKGTHTFKFGAEWMHTMNDQVFRGFFTGRYLFDSVSGFLRYSSPSAPGGFGPNTVGCSGGVYVTAPSPCPGGTTPTGGPLLFYLQGADRAGVATDAAGASTIRNNEFSLFAQDQWQATPRLSINYGIRWDVQLMPDTIDPTTTAYGPYLSDPRFPSDGTIPDQWKMIQPRLGMAWDMNGDGKSVVRASAGVYSARQNMLSQVGSVTTNGLQQQTIYMDTSIMRQFGAPTPVWPGVLTPAPLPPGTFPLFSGVRVFDRDYQNPRIYALNAAFEQEIREHLAGYVDFIWTKGTKLTRFLHGNRGAATCCNIGPGTGNAMAYAPGPFAPQLDEVMVTTSRGKSLYRGMTVGLRKRFADGHQFEINYVLAKDEDDDSNERDPFVDYSFNVHDLSLDYGLSARDIRHKFNAFGYFEIRGFQLNTRLQARSAQPITPNPRVLNGVDRGRNTLRKDNKYFSFDWRLGYPIRFGGGRYQLIPVVEMFNTFNNDNNINPLATPALFDFSGFLRTGVGDPRQVQLAVKFVF
jgi:outer membrane receptor protein involved in Fe transport